MTLYDLLWRNEGQVLTPELIAGICLGMQPEPPSDKSLINQIPLTERTKESNGYVFSIERLADCFTEIVEQHTAQWQEVERARDGYFKPDYQAAGLAEVSGRRVQFTVRHNGELVGNCGCYISKSLHTQRLKGAEDTMYIAPDHRKGLLATRFFRFCEQKLLQLGVKEITVSTKVTNDVHRLWERQGYEFTDRVLTKVFED